MAGTRFVGTLPNGDMVSGIGCCISPAHSTELITAIADRPGRKGAPGLAIVEQGRMPPISS